MFDQDPRRMEAKESISPRSSLVWLEGVEVAGDVVVAVGGGRCAQEDDVSTKYLFRQASVRNKQLCWNATLSVRNTPIPTLTSSGSKSSTFAVRYNGSH